MRMLPVLALCVMVLGTGACTSSPPPETLQKELMEVDRAFCEAAIEKGRTAAFLEFMAPDGVIYPWQGSPIHGIEQFRELAGKADAGAVEPTFVWEPLYADVAESGELGYTLGSYTATIDGPEGPQLVRRGHYVTIWKKQEDGFWKFVFDGGNQLPAESVAEEDQDGI
jgi:ketosteroid isomerase-like protein